MSEPQVGQVWTDGYYRFNDGEASYICYVHDGVVGDDPIEWFLSEDAPYGLHTVEPVRVLDQAEYDDLQAQIHALERHLASATPSDEVPDDIRHIIRRWRDNFQQRATAKLDTPADFVGRMWLDEVAQIDAWLATQGTGGEVNDAS